MTQPSGGYGFIGSANTLSGSSGDDSGEWYAATVQYDGPSLRYVPYVGQRDANGEWFSSTVYFDGNVMMHINALLAGFKGQAWPLNVFVRLIPFWNPTQTSPNQGQLFPIAAGTGGPGQVFPY